MFPTEPIRRHCDLALPSDVRKWPEADVQQAPENVGLLGKSRHRSKKASLLLVTQQRHRPRTYPPSA